MTQKVNSAKQLKEFISQCDQEIGHLKYRKEISTQLIEQIDKMIKHEESRISRFLEMITIWNDKKEGEK